jgi:hypothetical protein
MWTRVTMSFLVGTYYIDWFNYQLTNCAEIASKDLHGYFDGQAWLLMPEDDIVDKFYESLETSMGATRAIREKFPDYSVCLLIMT